MEAKNDSSIISDSEFLALLQDAKKDDPVAKLKLIELFKGDILSLSKFIYLPQEDAVAEIELEILEFIKNSDD